MTLILLSVFSPKNVKKALLDILKAQSPAISSFHTHGASSAAHGDLIDTCHLEKGFCQCMRPSSQNWVWGDLLPSRISATWTLPLSPCRGSELRSFGYLLAAANPKQPVLGEQPLYCRVYRVLLSHPVQSMNLRRSLGLLAEIVCLGSVHQPVT